MMGWYERVVFRGAMERVLGRAPVCAERRETLARARGAILEAGIATGLNLEAYPTGVDSLIALGYERRLDPRAAARAEKRAIAVRLVSGDATCMPFHDGSFDTVVCTFLLCSVGDGAAAVREFRRVLRSDGHLLFLEHVAHRTGGKRLVQHILNPLSLLLSCGCSLVRDSAATIADNGFRFDELVDHDLGAMLWPHRRVIRGAASPA